MRGAHIIRGIGFMHQKAACENFDEQDDISNCDGASDSSEVIPAGAILDSMRFWPQYFVSC